VIVDPRSSISPGVTPSRVYAALLMHFGRLSGRFRRGRGFLLGVGIFVHPDRSRLDSFFRNRRN
jgi:hypothetical protein